VVAYDGTDEARAALLWALAEKAPVVPVAVLENERDTRRIVSCWDEDGAELRDVAELQVVRGHAAPTLARVAADQGADLIVIGHHRGRHLQGLRPSVTEDLIRLAPCPVVVV
jgi:nucleotide-binding universal stress UspA family protein